MNTKITTAVSVVVGAVIIVALTLWVASFTLFAGATSTESAATTLTLLQSKPKLVTVNDPTGQDGLLEFFSGDLTTTSGDNAGVLAGTLLIVDVNDGPRGDHEARQRTLTFDTPDGQIQALGLSYYPQAELELAQGQPVVISIVGGTGKFLGVTGEVQTTRQADGTYEHIFTFVSH